MKDLLRKLLIEAGYLALFAGLEIVLTLAVAVFAAFMTKEAQAGEVLGAGSLVHVTPYFELGAGYAPSSTPWSQQMDDGYYSWKGSNPVAIISGGVEVRWSDKQTGHLDIGGTHISNWRTGWPVNGEHETGLDIIHVKYRWRF